MTYGLLRATLSRQRAQLEVLPIHTRVEPVRAYAQQIAQLTGGSFSVVTIPEGSTAFDMGYRFVSVPDDELEIYQAGGASVVPGGLCLKDGVLAYPEKPGGDELVLAR